MIRRLYGAPIRIKLRTPIQLMLLYNFLHPPFAMRTVVLREGAGAVRTFHRCGDTGRAPVNAFKSENDLYQNSPRIPQRSGARVSLRVPGELAVELSGQRTAVGKAQLGVRGGERQALPLNATRIVATSQWRYISGME